MEEKLKKGQYLDTLLRSSKTVFSTKDIALLWGETNETAARMRLSYYVKTGGLVRLHRGLYAKDANYDTFELATKMYTPSYVSFETVLARAGVVFQYYDRIFIASYVAREVVVAGVKFAYRRMRDSVLTNPLGLEAKDNYHIASPERAFLDVVYLNKDYHFDNLSSLNWDTVFEIASMYNNKSLEKRVKAYHTLIAH